MFASQVDSTVNRLRIQSEYYQLSFGIDSLKAMLTKLEKLIAKGSEKEAKAARVPAGMLEEAKKKLPAAQHAAKELAEKLKKLQQAAVDNSGG